MNPLIQRLKNYGEMSAEAESALAGKTRHWEKKKGDHFLIQGQRSSSYFLLEKGLLRAYFFKNDKEVNSWFGGENEIFGSIIPTYTLLPSFENIQFLEDSSVFSISSEDLNELYVQFPELNAIGRKIAEEVCIILEERIFSLHTQSATERYESLITKTPFIIRRVSLGHIASYLGITQETLSRIRKL